MLLGIEISRSEVAAILSDTTGAAQYALRQSFAPNAPPATQWMSAMELCRSLLHRAGIEAGAVLGAGISFESPVSRAGIVQKDPTRPGWENYDLLRGLREHLGLEKGNAASRALCAGLGEAYFGALRGQTDWLHLHLDAHLESSLCLNGQIVGGNAGAAGDLGGLVVERDGALDGWGKRGTLRAYCSGQSFELNARSYGLTFARATEVWSLSASNFAAQSVTEDYVSRLAQGIAGALSLCEPAKICIGGEFGTAIFDFLSAPLASKLRDMAPTLSPRDTLIKAQLGADAPCLGAIALAQQVFQAPSQPNSA